MHPNARKNQKLIRQYPFIETILRRRMEPDAPYERGGYDHMLKAAILFDDLTIRVEKADGDLMFRRAYNVGLGDSSFIFQLTGKREGQVGRCGEYLFAIDGQGKIVNRVDWPRNDEEQRKTGDVYGWSALWSGRGELSGSRYSIHDKVHYLVWVTVEAWHTDTKNDDVLGGRFGEFRDRSVRIIIYRAPAEGFKELQEKSSVYSNLCLDSDTMMRGVMNKNYDIVSMGGMLYEMCITFQDEVYFNGMKEVLDNGSFRGASGQFGPVKVLCAEMCGYDRVVLKDTKSYVTFQLRPGSKHMYVHGQQGTLPQIRNLVRTVVRMWRENPASRAAFKSDEKVSVL